MAMQQFVEHKIAKHVTVISHSTFTAKDGTRIPCLNLWFANDQERDAFYEDLKKARKGKS